MRYHYEKPDLYRRVYGETYRCDHPLYSFCTLFLIGGKGLAVIQQRFDEETKSTYWSNIDPWVANELYTHERFKDFFDRTADYPTGGIYPTVTVRQIMWALRMKPIVKEPWETYFINSQIL